MAFHPTSKDIWYDAPHSAADLRLKAQHAEEERAALRASELAEQIAPTKDAGERIQVWERLHALPLPRASSHMLVKVIATQTGLTIDQVHDEQARRAASVARPQPLRPTAK